MADGPKILTLDIETSPNLAHVWSLWNVNVGLSQLRDSGQVISFAAKWFGDRKVFFHSDFHDGHPAMVRAAHALLDEADVLVHYNGNTFDIPHLNAEFARAGMTPPSPYKQVDLLRVVKSNFRFPSNKLQYVSTALGLEGKLQHAGHELWVKCMADDPKAWNIMRRYNKQDVVLTEKLYEKLLPWAGGHPHTGLYAVDGARECCARCGSEDLERRGFAYTPLGKFQQYRCKGCGGWSRGGKRLEAVTLRAVK